MESVFFFFIISWGKTFHRVRHIEKSSRQFISLITQEKKNINKSLASSLTPTKGGGIGGTTTVAVLTKNFHQRGWREIVDVVYLRTAPVWIESLDDDCLFPIYHTSGEVNHESCAVQFRVNPKWEQESFSFFSVSVLFCFVLLERRSFGRRGQDTFPLCLLIVWPRLVFENNTFLSLSLSFSLPHWNSDTFLGRPDCLASFPWYIWLGDNHFGV
jgi:hypothetical protein